MNTRTVKFDVFLSHNSRDKPAIRKISRELKVRQVRCWLDEEQLTPGRNWVEALGNAIDECRTTAVFLGAEGLGNWHRREMQVVINESVSRCRPVIPVLLPDAPADLELPAFLKVIHAVDLRGGLEQRGIDDLYHGIMGKRWTGPHLESEQPEDVLPLPLAQLYSRAQNSTSPQERHEGAIRLWDATLKLMAYTAIAELAEVCPGDEELLELVQSRLADAGSESLLEMSRQLMEKLAEHGDDEYASLSDQINDVEQIRAPAAVNLNAMLSGEAPGQSVGLGQLFESLALHKSERIGLDAPVSLSSDQHSEYTRQLLTAFTSLFLDRDIDVLADRRLMYVGDVRRQSTEADDSQQDGESVWLIQEYELRGKSTHVEYVEVQGSAEIQSSLPDPEQIILRAPIQAGVGGLSGVPVSKAASQLANIRYLEPLILYFGDRKQVYFLSGCNDKQQAEYLNYLSGDHVKRDAHDVMDLLARRLRGENPKRTNLVAPLQTVTSPDRVTGSLKKLGSFELEAPIGAGSFGRVFIARQPSLSRKVAVKVLHNPGDPQTASRFSREITALGQVEHPNLVKVYCSENDPDSERFFYAMELIEGANLEDIWRELVKIEPGLVDAFYLDAFAKASTHDSLLDETVVDAADMVLDRQPTSRLRATSPPPSIAGVVPPDQSPKKYDRWIAGLMRQVALAAHELHKARIVHRDIKPANIMVTDDSKRAVLMDWGLAKMDTNQALTRTMGELGTPRYASPQQLISPKDANEQDDVYSLGATLWELLALRPLYDADKDTSYAKLVVRVQHEEPRRIREFRTTVARDLEAIVLKCLRKKPDERYTSALQLAKDLENWACGDPVIAQPLTHRYMLRKSFEKYWLRYLIVTATVLGAFAVLLTALIFVNTSRNVAVKAKLAAVAAEADAVEARDRAFGVVKKYLHEVGDESRLERSLRKELLLKALTEYNALWQDNRSDLQFVSQNAAAYADVCMLLGVITWEEGQVHGGTPRLTEAVDHLQKAEQIWDDLRAATGDDHDALVSCAMKQLDNLILLMQVAVDAVHREDSRRAVVRALEVDVRKIADRLIEKVQEVSPHNVEIQIQQLRFEAANVLLNQDELSTGKLEQLEAKLTQSDSVRANAERAHVNKLIGWAHYQANNYDAAQERLRAARDLFFIVEAAAPDEFKRNFFKNRDAADNDYRLGLTVTRLHHTSKAVKLTNNKEAMTFYKDASDRFDDLVQLGYDSVDIHRRRALCLYAFADLTGSYLTDYKDNFTKLTEIDQANRKALNLYHQALVSWEKVRTRAESASAIKTEGSWASDECALAAKKLADAEHFPYPDRQDLAFRLMLEILKTRLGDASLTVSDRMSVAREYIRVVNEFHRFRSSVLKDESLVYQEWEAVHRLLSTLQSQTTSAADKEWLAERIAVAKDVMHELQDAP